MGRYLIAIFLSIIVTSFDFPEYNSEVGKVNWVTMQEAIDLSKKNPKKIVVDMYTDWCGWCKKLDRDVYGHPIISAYLNEKFYAVKFNTEKMTSPVTFKGQVFNYIPPPKGGRRGIHELAYYLMNEKASYPTTVFIDENLNPIQPIPGYQKAPYFDTIIKFLGENKYKEMSWPDFQNSYKSPVGS